MTHTTISPRVRMLLKANILSLVNLKNYDNMMIGQYVETQYGDFVCIEKPSIMHGIDSRKWVFEQTTTADGEPYTYGGATVTILS